MQINTKIVSCHTAHSKPVKQKVNGTTPFSIPWLKEGRVVIQLFLIYCLLLQLLSREINICSTAFNSQVWPPPFNWPAYCKKSVDEQKSKMELEI
jgi:hypothetical protein